MCVSCYTAAPEAELFLNGVSLGKKPVSQEDGYRACWIVPYCGGELTAKVEGAQDTLCTPGAAASLSLHSDAKELHADGQSIAQIEVLLADENGNPCAEDLPVTCQILGDARIIGIENGQPDDLTPYSSSTRRTFRGKAIVYVRAGLLPGEITLHCYTRSGLSAQTKVLQK